MKNRIMIKVTIWTIFFTIGCTENPFFKDKAITGNKISGRIQLRDAMNSNQNIYVWLEGFNTGVYTDQNGFFNLDITSSNQFGFNHNGNYKVYFYTNNYYLDSAKVVIVNNKIQYGEGDLNNEGELKNTVYLSKLLAIEIIVDQEVIHPDSCDSIKFQIILDAITDTVTIQTQITGPLDLSAAFLKKTDPPEQHILINYGGSIFYEIPIYPEYAIPNYKRSFNMGVEYDPAMLPPGEYQFIPYIMVSYPNEIKVKYNKVPSKLLENLGIVGKELTTNFLNIPMVINGGSFKVIQN